jgi:hypothetical protein
LKIKKVIALNVHFVHTFLAHKKDLADLKTDLRKGKNVKRI